MVMETVLLQTVSYMLMKSIQARHHLSSRMECSRTSAAEVRAVFPTHLAAVGNTLYFSADDGTNGRELWKSDGTASGTVMVKDINSGSGRQLSLLLTVIGTTLYFQADDGTNGRELWKSDGTASGTVMVKDINSGSECSSSPYDLTAVGNTLYFSATDGTNGTNCGRAMEQPQAR